MQKAKLDLRVAIQKSGRLSDRSRELLKQSGIRFDAGNDRLISKAKDHPLELLLVRDDDIPSFVRNQICQLAIVGLNVLKEKGEEGIEIIRPLGFGHCRLVLAAPKSIERIDQLNGRRIATSYPNLLQAFLDSQDIRATVVPMTGSVEMAPSVDIADAICDLVATGNTLRSHGLYEIRDILSSEAVLIRPERRLEMEQEHLLCSLLQRFDGVQKANSSKYIMMNAPKDAVGRIAALVPGMEHPTVMPLVGDEDRVAIHAVTLEEVFWDTMQQLQAAGATSILVLPIEKIIE